MTPPGRELTAYLMKQLSGQEVIDRSELYAGYKDSSEYLQAILARATDEPQMIDRD